MFLLSRHAVLILEVPVGYRKVAALQLEASGMATGCPIPALRLSRRHRGTGVQWGPRVPSHKGLSHGGSHHGYPTEGVTKDNGGGEERGGGGLGHRQFGPGRHGSRGQNVETSISGSCWCGGHEAQRTSRQRPPTIVAGAERRQSLRRLHVAHPVLDHGVGCLAVAGMVGRRRAGGASTPALKAR